MTYASESRMKIAGSCAIALLAGFVSCLQGQTLVATGGSTRFAAGELGDDFPVWTGGVFVIVEKNLTPTPVIRTFDQTGRELPPIEFVIPDSDETGVFGVVHGEGGYVVCGQAFDQQKGREEGFISWISPDGQTLKTTRTFPYIPYMVTEAPDGTVWTEGAETVDGLETDPAVDPNRGVIRRFDKSGVQIGSFLPRSSVFPDGKWMGLPQGEMASNKDRIGWYARIAQQYVEITYEGAVRVYAGFAPPMSEPRITNLVLLDSGEVVAGASANRGGNFLYRLDRSSGAWMPVEVPGAPVTPQLYGGDHDQLALWASDPATFKIVFFALDK